MQESNDLASDEHKTQQILPQRRKRGKKTQLGRTKKGDTRGNNSRVQRRKGERETMMRIQNRMTLMTLLRASLRQQAIGI